ncbi:MAG: NYN domain-containing protein, partial [Bacteriovoracia bacterium]
MSDKISKRKVFIDGANLHKSAKELGFNIDYKKFYGWLKQKYRADSVYLFLGYIPENEKVYKKLEKIGYLIIYKETVNYLKDKVKGNCDTDLVLKVCSEFYENNVRDFILISSDGDFSSLVDFLIMKKVN